MYYDLLINDLNNFQQRVKELEKERDIYRSDYGTAQQEMSELEQRLLVIKDKIKYKISIVKSDHTISTGEYKHYLTGQYDAYSYILSVLKRGE